MQGVVISACNLNRQQAEAEELSVHASSDYIGRPCLSHSPRKGREQARLSLWRWLVSGWKRDSGIGDKYVIILAGRGTTLARKRGGGCADSRHHR